jgi:serine acetyltransferase
LTRALLQVLLLAMPWRVRRWALNSLFGYVIAPTARIGLSLVLAERVVLKERARIGNLTVVKRLASLVVEESGSLGNLNWVTGMPPGPSGHFARECQRDPSLHIGRHAAITHRHLIDCTDRVTIGPFATVGGWRSQILTHAIDLQVGRQSCAPVEIGHHCFVGTGVIILKGSSLPAESILAAGSVLNASMKGEGMIYGGVPAIPIRSLDRQGNYFTREIGIVG